MDFYKIGLEKTLELLEDKLAKISNKIFETGMPAEVVVELDNCQDILREVINTLKEDNKND